MTLTTWADVRPGTIITVKKYHFARPFKFLVDEAPKPLTATADPRYAFVYGRRLRMDGTPSTGKSFKATFDVVHLEDVKAQEWDMAAVEAEAHQQHTAKRRHNADGRRARGTSNGNSRGGSAARRARKAFLLREFGDGTEAPCSFGCGTQLTMATVSVDRYPVPGCQGGTYARGNIRPVCGRCNSSHGATVRRGSINA